jgi:hypothetical protein
MLPRRLLQRLFACTLVSLAPLSAPGKEAEPAPSAVPAVPLSDLVRIWKDYGLPLPPADAPLVRFTTGSRRLEEDGTGTPLFSMGFQLEAPTASKAGVILAGFTKIEQKQGRGLVIESIKPESEALQGPDLYEEAPGNGANSLIGTAIQCEARGWSKIAGPLLAIALANGAGHPYSATGQRSGMDAQAALYLFVWNYLQTEAMRPRCDRSGLAVKMKRLLDSGHDLPRNGGKWLYDALHAAAQPGKGVPGTPEAAIDRLIDSRKGGGAMGGGTEASMDDPYYQLEALGFAAVPALLEHLDDPRLTCSMMVGFNNFPDWPRRVGDLVSDLLQDLSGGELGADWLQRQKGAGVAENAARDWWSRAQKLGEERWLVEGAVAKADKDNSFPNACHLRLLLARYPQRLADVLRAQMKERPKAQIHPMITALEESRLPAAEKTALFKEAGAHRNPETRRMALLALSKLDPAFANAEAIKAFDGMSKKARGPYWTSPEANLSHLALGTDDAAVWAAFLRAAKRAEPGLRMELMNPLDYTYVGENLKSRRIHFLSAFLDDTTPRVIPGGEDEGKFSGPCAGFTFPCLRVCDLAAMKLASVLDWKDAPDENWTEAQWNDLRRRCRQAGAGQ